VLARGVARELRGGERGTRLDAEVRASSAFGAYFIRTAVSRALIDTVLER